MPECGSPGPHAEGHAHPLRGYPDRGSSLLGVHLRLIAGRLAPPRPPPPGPLPQQLGEGERGPAPYLASLPQLLGEGARGWGPGSARLIVLLFLKLTPRSADPRSAWRGPRHAD